MNRENREEREQLEQKIWDLDVEIEALELEKSGFERQLCELEDDEEE